MFFDLLCLLGGFLYLSGKGINSGANKIVSENYMKAQKYNLDRQHQLEQMLYNIDLKVRREFERMARRTIDLGNGYDCDCAVREVSLREGWKYYNVAEACSDPVYVKTDLRGKWDKGRVPYQWTNSSIRGEERALASIKEADEREVWIERNPDALKFDLLPMDFTSEEAFAEEIRKLNEKMEQGLPMRTYKEWRLYWRVNVSTGITRKWEIF